MMAKNPLFSTYRQGENRVTSSMLAVFERIDLSLLETILAAAAGESSLQMVSFTNQPPSKGRSVPDARISANFAYWFEVKTTRNALDSHQLAEHLTNLGEASGSNAERLFVITPDAEQPVAITACRDPGWCGSTSEPYTTPSTSRSATRPGPCRSRLGSCCESCKRC